MRRGTSLLLIGIVVVGGACSHPGATYTAQLSIDSLTAHGWKAASAGGMPNTASGLPQVGYLEMTSPQGHRLDGQFMTDPSAATKEAAAVLAQDPAFTSVVIGNVLVFVPPNGADPVAAADQAALASLLR